MVALSSMASSLICGALDQLPHANSSMSISSRAATASIASKSVSGRLSVIIPIFIIMLPLVVSVAGAKLAHVGNDGVDRRDRRVPCAHQAHTRGADEFVELPALFAQRDDYRKRQVDEHPVGFDRRQQARPGYVRESVGQPLGHGIRMRGMAQPGAVLENPEPRRGEKAHFRGELAALHAPPPELLREIAIEEHDRLAERKAVLGAAEGQHVHAGAPCDVGRRAVERRNGIREPRAVDVHLHPALVRELAQVP